MVNSTKYTIHDINKFFEEEIFKKSINAEDDIFLLYGVAGDDCHEMMEKYAFTFKVNMDKYLWYFHSDEEGGDIYRRSVFQTAI
jgi:hypothetical protein